LIDINNNINLKCNCTLVKFQKYLNNYNDLTCTQQGQDRYYISTLTNWFSDCSYDICLDEQQHTKLNFCNWADAERATYEGTCEAKMKASDKRKKMKSQLTLTETTLINSQWLENTTETRNLTTIENTTIIPLEKNSISNSISMKTNIYLILIILFVFLLL
ncbi:unnamed protein product, partial [Rotaria sp. Silwood2]